VTPAQRFAVARVARLATVGADGAPHLVPIVFAVAGDVIHSAVDAKPKRHRNLRRLANIAHEPRVSLLADHYDDGDWDALWWVRADGVGAVHEPGEPVAARAVELLAGWREERPLLVVVRPVLAVAVTRWSGWAAR